MGRKGTVTENAVAVEDIGEHRRTVDRHGDRAPNGGVGKDRMRLRLEFPVPQPHSEEAVRELPIRNAVRDLAAVETRRLIYREDLVEIGFAGEDGGGRRVRRLAEEKHEPIEFRASL